MKSINRTLFILVLFTMLPVVAIFLYSGFVQSKHSVAKAKQDIFLITHAMAEVQEDLTHSVRQTLSVLSLLSEVKSLDAPKVSAIVKAIVRENQEYHNISLVALDGYVVASARDLGSDINLGDRKHVRQAIEERNFSAGEFILGRAGSRTPIFPYAFPVFDENLQLIAVLTASIKLSYFMDFHEIAKMPKNSFVAATDHQGLRLFYYPPQDASNPVGGKIKTSVWKQVGDLEEGVKQGSFVTLNSDGERRIIAFEQIRIPNNPRPYMYLWAGIPEKQILVPAREALGRNLFFLFVSMVLSLLFFALMGKRYLIQPIHRIVNLTQKFAEGKPNPYTDLGTGPEELRVLNDAFFDMASELGKSQQTLRESECRFREIFNNMTNGVIIFEPIHDGDNFVVKDINFAGLALGSFSREAVLGKTLLSALAQIFDSAFLGVLQRVYQTTLPEHYPVTTYENESVKLWVECYVFMLPTGEVVVVYRDITRRKQVEEERSRSEAKFRAIIDQASDAIHMVDEDGKILLVNRRACETLGYSEEELLQLNVNDIYPVYRYKNFEKEIWHPLEMGDIDTVETTLKDKNGRQFPVEIHVSRIDMGNQKASLGMVRDISSRKEYEASLKQSKEEWENTFNAMSDYITIQDKNMNILRANKAFYEKFPEHCTSSILPPCYKVFHSDKNICQDCPSCRTFVDGTIHHQEITNEAKNTTYSISTFPIVDEKGNVEHIVHIAKDITKRKKLEEELFQAHKMEAIGTLAGGIAHDFNNILSGIMGFAEFIREDVVPGSQTAEDANEILIATNRAKDLVKQILSFSRKNDREKSVIEPHLVVWEALNMLRSTIPTSIIVTEDIRADCGTILVNSTSLHQVVLNLCANARYAMKDEKGEMHILLRKVERTARQLPLEKDLHLGCFVLLQVVDNGCGIAKEDLERVFEPYYTTREVGSGSGLGLSVIHGIVEDCSGFIEVESEVGEGTTFSVYFPCHNEAALVENQTAAKEQATPAENIGKILLVDDEPLILEINSRILEKYGYQCVVTDSSIEALAILTKEPDAFDLLITDQTMPGLTGDDLARQVLKVKPSLPVIICTGHSDVFSEEKAFAMGIKKYLYKPILADELVSGVREVIVDNGGQGNGLV